MSTRHPALSAPTPAEHTVRERLHHVIAVDDAEDILSAVRGIFAAHYPATHLETFSDPLAALAALHVEAPDLLITDLRMTSISGIELIWQAREVQPALPIVVVSAFGTPELRAQIARRHAMPFVEKPFTEAALRSAVTQAVANAWAEELGLEAEIAQPTALDSIQLCTLAAATGRLDLTHASHTAKVWFEHGTVVHAEHSGAVDAAAMAAIAPWVGAKSVFHTGETLPETPAVSPIDIDKTAAGAPHQKGSIDMANVKETLHELSEIDGFVGACVVDSNSGMMLGAHGGGSVNLEV